MPTPDVILNGLTTLANDWRALATAWHLLLATVIGMFAAGWRPSGRVAGYLGASPVAVVIGSTLTLRNSGSTAWHTALIAAGFLYGSIGVFKLGVVLDWGLILGSIVIAAVAWHESVVEASSHRRQAA